ncbi:hypothetical protein JZ751_014388, partial [Albula glossodonta]
MEEKGFGGTGAPASLSAHTPAQGLVTQRIINAHSTVLRGAFKEMLYAAQDQAPSTEGAVQAEEACSEHCVLTSVHLKRRMSEVQELRGQR